MAQKTNKWIHKAILIMMYPNLGALAIPYKYMMQ